jgi:hypothetical protein
MKEERAKRPMRGLIAFILLTLVFWIEFITLNFKMIPDLLTLHSDTGLKLNWTLTHIIPLQHFLVTWYGMVFLAVAMVLGWYGGIRLWINRSASFTWIPWAVITAIIVLTTFAVAACSLPIYLEATVLTPPYVISIGLGFAVSADYPSAIGKSRIYAAPDPGRARSIARRR